MDALTQDMSGDPDADGRFVRLDDGDMRVVEDGDPDAPAVLLIHGSAGSTAWWDPVVLATALAEQRPDKVWALTLIDVGPSLDAAAPEGLLVRLLLARLPGRLLWRLRNETTIRKAMRSAFNRPLDVPDAIIEAALGMTQPALAGTAHGALQYMGQRSLPDRLAALGIRVLVIFGTEDARYRSSSAADYRVVPGARVELLPGVGHTPMMEDPETTGTLLLEFLAAAAPAS